MDDYSTVRRLDRSRISADNGATENRFYDRSLLPKAGKLCRGLDSGFVTRLTIPSEQTLRLLELLTNIVRMVTNVPVRDVRIIPVRLAATGQEVKRGDSVAKNVHIWCGYVEIPDLPGKYLSGFRIVIPDEFDQTLQCGADEAFDTPEEATVFAQSNANAYLNLLAVFGIIDPEDIERTFWEWISTN